MILVQNGPSCSHPELKAESAPRRRLGSRIWEQEEFLKTHPAPVFAIECWGFTNTGAGGIFENSSCSHISGFFSFLAAIGRRSLPQGGNFGAIWNTCWDSWTFDF